MSSNAQSTAQSIFDTLFGCCLGRRRGESQGANDERTPLLGGARQAGTGAATEGQQSPGSASKGGQAGQVGIAKSNLPRRPKKPSVDSEKLRSIRTKAKTALFDVENGQLLPSSSSLAQQKASMGHSQRMQAKRETSRDRRESAVDTQRQELITASDKAERLYKAALQAAAGKEHASEVMQEGQAAALEQAPIGLVRQVRLSVYDDSRAKSRAAPKFSLESSSSESSMNSGREEGGSGAAGVSAMSLIQKGKQQGNQSTHSLRTLKLAYKSEQSTNEDDPATLLLGKSVQSSSNATTTEGGQDDETSWEQRGRTRSKRGLVWMDTGVNRKEPAAEEKPALKDIWSARHDAEDEIPHGLRFNVNVRQGGGHERDQLDRKTIAILDRLKRSLQSDSASSQDFYQSWGQSDDLIAEKTGNGNGNGGNGGNGGYGGGTTNEHHKDNVQATATAATATTTFQEV